MKVPLILLAAVLLSFHAGALEPGQPAIQPWPSQPPDGCSFPQSGSITGIAFTGNHAEYTNADTWYPSWASDGNMYSPWTDGNVNGLIDWNNNCGCVTMTYNAPLRKYLMCVTDGRTTVSEFNTYILESDQITGPWHLVTYMANFGEQGYSVNFPSKFISPDGRTAWLCYAANFTKGHQSNPPGSRYGMCLQEVRLLSKESK